MVARYVYYMAVMSAPSKLARAVADIATILEEHARWLADPATGARADLEGADLRDAKGLPTP